MAVGIERKTPLTIVEISEPAQVSGCVSKSFNEFFPRLGPILRELADNRLSIRVNVAELFFEADIQTDILSFEASLSNTPDALFNIMFDRIRNYRPSGAGAKNPAFTWRHCGLLQGSFSGRPYTIPGSSSSQNRAFLPIFLGSCSHSSTPLKLVRNIHSDHPRPSP